MAIALPAVLAGPGLVTRRPTTTNVLSTTARVNPQTKLSVGNAKRASHQPQTVYLARPQPAAAQHQIVLVHHLVEMLLLPRLDSAEALQPELLQEVQLESLLSEEALLKQPRVDHRNLQPRLWTPEYRKKRDDCGYRFELFDKTLMFPLTYLFYDSYN